MTQASNAHLPCRPPFGGRISGFPLLAAVLVSLSPRAVSGADPFAEHVRSTEPLSPEQEQKSFHLPPGFEIHLVASEPEIGKVMNMAFDAKGRLWVTISREYPFPVPLDKVSRDSIKILEDFDATGRARKVTTFADGLNIPIGLYPYRNGVIAWSIPNIWFLQDTDGDGQADRREVLYGPLGWERDTHGLNASFRRGFDGWLYVTHGYNNDSTVRGKDGHEIRMNSGNTYRGRLDGSRVEQHTWGQVNPFGMCFDALGNMYTADCHSAPIYQLLRGAYYPSFGKPDDGLGFGPVLLEHSHGSTAIAGIAYSSGDQWPPEFQNNIFIGNVMTSRINRDQIVFQGSSPRAREMPDFVRTDDPWFRPVDLQFGPDGALYVSDFYNRIIGHYEVPLTHPGRDRERGRIWRITYTGTDSPAPQTVPGDFDVSQAPVPDLITALAHPNLTRRMLATDQLSDRAGAAARQPLQECLREEQSAPLQKIHALWVLYRLDSLELDLLGRAARSSDYTVRTHAMKVLSETSPWQTGHRELVLAALQDSNPHVQRAAADALGQHPDYEHISPLLSLRRAVPEADDHLLHTVRMALRNQLRPPAVLSRVQTQAWSQEEARILADVAAGVPSAEAGSFLLHHLQKVQENDLQTARFFRHAARYGPPQQIGPLTAFAREKFSEDLEAQSALFRSMQEGAAQRGAPLTPEVQAWGRDLAERLLSSEDPGTRGWARRQRAAADLVGALLLTHLEAKLAAILVLPSADLETRAAVARALGALHPDESISTLAPLVGDAAIPAELRVRISRCLADPASHDSVAVLVEALRTSSFRVQLRLAEALARTASGGRQLLEAIERSQASPRLLLNRSVHATLTAANPATAARIAQLTHGLDPEPEQLARLLTSRRARYVPAAADPQRGAQVFAKTCAVCHQLDGQGTVIGPQLDGIGQRGLERLIEDVLDPNRNVDPSFRTHIIRLKDGDIVSGLPRREEGELLVIADSTGRESSIPKKDIDARRESETSLMPEGFGDVLSPEEFNDLMSFLLSKTAAPGTQ